MPNAMVRNPASVGDNPSAAVGGRPHRLACSPVFRPTTRPCSSAQILLSEDEAADDGGDAAAVDGAVASADNDAAAGE